MKQGAMPKGSHSKAMLAAMASAAKGKMPQVHEMPAKKEHKGMSVPESPDAYYYPPTVYLGDKDFPGIEHWKAGDKVTLVVAATVKNVSVSQYNNEKKRWNADLELTAIADITNKGGGKE